MVMANRTRRTDAESSGRDCRCCDVVPECRGWILIACFLWCFLGAPTLVLAGGQGTGPGQSGQQKVFLGPPVRDVHLGKKRTENPLVVVPPQTGRGVKLWDEARFSSESPSGASSREHHLFLSGTKRP
ncbi:hypothetical protein BOX30_08570 [Leptospirillum ferriphilum]|uniref:Uncharacterized protein n=1 Tax=Leptospirillum ferriphilum TaxID=178606 RepID=A0A1V3SYL8_9BACT|nr:hypothetical protein BOX24_02150 [Leptospirillum ferriphilum]OOH78430.1 hypothetical protein BOX30_08570 [Leptospirillum ferriphilum]